MSDQSGRTKLVVVEGPEGAGKSTQLVPLADRLRTRGDEVVMVREPGGTQLGDAVRQVVLGSDWEFSARAEALLFMASRAELVESVIRPALDRGAWVLADRFFLATYAYQGAGRGVAHEDIRTANRVATDGLVPGLTLLFQIPVEDGLARVMQRGKRDRIERVDTEFHLRVGRAFDEFASSQWQERHPECGEIVAIDGTKSEADVQQQIRAAVDSRWPDRGR